MSNISTVGNSLATKHAKLCSAAVEIERLAQEYHSSIQPGLAAMQAVADVPLDDRERWCDSVSSLAHWLSANGMADVPASVVNAERWERKDAYEPGRAFAGQAFCKSLAAGIKDGSLAAEFFAAFDNYKFITPSDATSEIRDVLRFLLHGHIKRIAPEFERRYGEILAKAGVDGGSLSYSLKLYGEPLSAESIYAIQDWVEWRSNMATFNVQIRDIATHSQPLVSAVPDSEAEEHLTAGGMGITTEESKPPTDTHADRPARDPNQPSRDRQNDILAAIHTAAMPLTRPELIDAMKLKTEGKLGGNLAWMVANDHLINIPQRGYWFPSEPVPE